MNGKEDQPGDHIEVSGSGAVATHGGVAAGAGGVAVGRDVYGNITVIVQGENVRDKELAYLDGLLARYEYWRDHYIPLAAHPPGRWAARRSWSRPERRSRNASERLCGMHQVSVY